MALLSGVGCSVLAVTSLLLRRGLRRASFVPAEACSLVMRIRCPDLGWTTGSTSQPPEGLQILFVDGPERPHLDPIEPLTDQQSADVAVRGLEGGRDLGDREWMGPCHVLKVARFVLIFAAPRRAGSSDRRVEHRT